MWLPKSFCGWSLRIGSLAMGVLMCVVMIICILAATVQVALMSSSRWSVKEFIGRNAYAIAIVELIYCIFMLGVGMWFFWGVQMEKDSVILSWLVINTMWLSEVCCLLFVLICLYSFEVGVISWIFCFVFGVLTICLLVYGLLIVLAYWVELKKKKKEEYRHDHSQLQPPPHHTQPPTPEKT